MRVALLSYLSIVKGARSHCFSILTYVRKRVGCGQFCEYRVHILSRAVNFSLLAGPNPSEQKPNQTNKRLVCSYTAQKQQQKLGSCYFELFCNELSSIMTRAVATHPRSRTLHLRLLHGSSWTKLKALCFQCSAFD